jgi:hypothetical protein
VCERERERDKGINTATSNGNKESIHNDNEKYEGAISTELKKIDGI